MAVCVVRVTVVATAAGGAGDNLSEVDPEHACVQRVHVYLLQPLGDPGLPCRLLARLLLHQLAHLLLVSHTVLQRESNAPAASLCTSVAIAIAIAIGGSAGGVCFRFALLHERRDAEPFLSLTTQLLDIEGINLSKVGIAGITESFHF